jgi:hypothetical protein
VSDFGTPRRATEHLIFTLIRGNAEWHIEHETAVVHHCPMIDRRARRA